MSVTRFYEPFFSFSDVDSLLEDAFRSRNGRAVEKPDAPRVLKPRYVAASYYTPPLAYITIRMDLHENQETNTITATFELPGLTKDQVSIDVQNNHLTIAGQVSETSEKNQDGYVIKERSSGKFNRTLALPPYTKVRSQALPMNINVLTV